MATPEPTPRTQNPATPQDQRPDLRLVQASNTPPEATSEITEPTPGVDEPTDEVTPQAPLDVRLLDTVGGFLQSRPRWSERPPSMAEAWEYSTSGDWTADEKTAKRVPHGLCLLVAFIVTYPIGWAVHVARQKPIGFVLVVAVLFVLSKVL